MASDIKSRGAYLRIVDWSKAKIASPVPSLAVSSPDPFSSAPDSASTSAHSQPLRQEQPILDFPLCTREERDFELRQVKFLLDYENARATEMLKWARDREDIIRAEDFRQVRRGALDPRVLEVNYGWWTIAGKRPSVKTIAKQIHEVKDRRTGKFIVWDRRLEWQWSANELEQIRRIEPVITAHRRAALKYKRSLEEKKERLRKGEWYMDNVANLWYPGCGSPPAESVDKTDHRRITDTMQDWKRSSSKQDARVVRPPPTFYDECRVPWHSWRRTVPPPPPPSSDGSIILAPDLEKTDAERAVDRKSWGSMLIQDDKQNDTLNGRAGQYDGVSQPLYGEKITQSLSIMRGLAPPPVRPINDPIFEGWPDPPIGSLGSGGYRDKGKGKERAKPTPSLAHDLAMVRMRATDFPVTEDGLGTPAMGSPELDRDGDPDEDDIDGTVLYSENSATSSATSSSNSLSGALDPARLSDPAVASSSSLDPTSPWDDASVDPIADTLPPDNVEPSQQEQEDEDDDFLVRAERSMAEIREAQQNLQENMIREAEIARQHRTVVEVFKTLASPEMQNIMYAPDEEDEDDEDEENFEDMMAEYEEEYEEDASVAGQTLPPYIEPSDPSTSSAPISPPSSPSPPPHTPTHDAPPSLATIVQVTTHFGFSPHDNITIPSRGVYPPTPIDLIPHKLENGDEILRSHRQVTTGFSAEAVPNTRAYAAAERRESAYSRDSERWEGVQQPLNRSDKRWLEPKPYRPLPNRARRTAFVEKADADQFELPPAHVRKAYRAMYERMLAFFMEDETSPKKKQRKTKWLDDANMLIPRRGASAAKPPSGTRTSRDLHEETQFDTSSPELYVRYNSKDIMIRKRGFILNKRLLRSILYSAGERDEREKAFYSDLPQTEMYRKSVPLFKAIMPRPIQRRANQNVGSNVWAEAEYRKSSSGIFLLGASMLKIPVPNFSLLSPASSNATLIGDPFDDSFPAKVQPLSADRFRRAQFYGSPSGEVVSVDEDGVESVVDEMEVEHLTERAFRHLDSLSSPPPSPKKRGHEELEEHDTPSSLGSAGRVDRHKRSRIV